jgi:tetratricopeptide (TPR) repeat protein
VATVAEAFQTALRHHQTGKLDLAERLYQQIIVADPDHGDSHHLLGVLAFQKGRYDQAVHCITKALSSNPTAVVYHCNMGLAQQALERFDEAVASFEEAIRLSSGFPEAYNNLGALLFQQGKTEEALAHFKHALSLKPDYAEAHNNLGNALQQQGALEDGLAHLQEALRLNPNYPEAENNIAAGLLRKGNPKEAVVHCQNAIRLRPGYAKAHNNFGLALVELGKSSDAIIQYRETLRFDPTHAETYNNLSIALLQEDNVDEAVVCLQEALRIKPSFPEAHLSIATALLRHGSLEQALSHCGEAVALKWNFADARWFRSVLWLLQGNYEQGWQEFEWRWQLPGNSPRVFSQPLWDGSDLDGRRILLHAERGFGDTLQFIRYAPLVQERGGKVIVECQPALLRLLQGVKGIDCLVGHGNTLPEFDLQAPLLSLPGIFRTVLQTVPSRVPYVVADSQLIEQWRQELAKSINARLFKVGIAWQGNPTFYGDRLRSIPLTHLAALANVPGVQLISLQKGPGIEQLRYAGAKVVDLGKRLDEDSGAFMDTGAVMKNLDLVISSDTAVAHLAGALGVSVWVALTVAPDWRWLLERADSPWYPTMRLFRQRQEGDWSELFQRMAQDLAKRATDANTVNRV